MLDNYKDAFVLKSIGSYQKAVQLAGDASTRMFYRIYGSRGINYILCEDSQLKNSEISNYPYRIVYDLLKDNGVPVPEVYAWDSGGLLLVQDLGDGLLEAVYGELSSDQRKSTYEELINILVRIQTIEKTNHTIPFSLSFDMAKLMFEFDFFIEHALRGYFGLVIRDNIVDELRGEFEKISGILYKPKLFVLNHRDYISRNVIIEKSKSFLIDFQDARLGLPQYDLVSLLRDSSPLLSEDLFNHLKEYYFTLASAENVWEMSRDDFEYYFDIMAFQRNVKIIGTFGYQTFRMKKPKYQSYIKPTFAYLADYARRRTELRKAYTIIEDHIGARL
jgi:aminoglycoside/choline kinase family phosphotransferase